MKKVVTINGVLYGWSINYWDKEQVEGYRPLNELTKQNGWIERNNDWLLNPYKAGYIKLPKVEEL